MPRSTFPDRSGRPSDGPELPPLGGRSMAERRQAMLFRVQLMILGAKRQVTMMTAETNALLARALRSRR